MSIRTVIIEDDPGTSGIIAGWLRASADFEHLQSFAHPVAALREVATLRPDVALVDINLPGISGIEFVREAKPLLPATQFVMLTVYRDVEHIFSALSAGATGYLLKSTLRDQLFAAIKDVHDGGSPMSGDVARMVVRSFCRPAPARHELAELSEREREVLQLLATGYLYKEIADQLGIGVNTVSTYVRRIYEKLHVRSRAQAVAKLLNVPPEPPPA
ncbi:MAG: response regulator transcription factor [Opitutaceae bacterium]|nr:response regulator transcription factor [Opitutaceae bacterium]